MKSLTSYRKHIQSNEGDSPPIELMIVIVIIGILAAGAIPIFMNQQKTAIIASLQNDVKTQPQTSSHLLVKSPTAVQVTADVQPGDTGAQKGTVRSADGSGILRIDVVKSSLNFYSKRFTNSHTRVLHLKPQGSPH